MKDILLLILLQAIWSSSYVAMKLALVSMPVGLVMILRYGIAALVLLLCIRFKGLSQLSKRDWLLVVAIGIATFTVSPYFQLKSLMMTQAIDVSILVSLEPLITALAAALLLKERLTWDLAVVFLLATAGLLIMSGLPITPASPINGDRLLGNMLFLAALCCEAAYSLTGRALTQRYPPLRLTAWMFATGSLVNLLLNLQTLNALPSLTEGRSSWVAILYMALFASALGYAGWYFLVRRIPVSRLALSLFLQPVIGSVLGFYVMGENLDKNTLLGGGLIVATLLGWVLKGVRR